MADGTASSTASQGSIASRTKRRVFLELAFSYTIILLVVWMPRPWQRHLWWVAAVAIGVLLCLSFDGLKAMGLCPSSFFRSLWVVCVALVLAACAVTIAAYLHTLRLPNSTAMFIKTFWAYTLWSAVQQFLLQCFFLSRLLRLIPKPKSAAAAAALLFALAHLPNPFLTPITLLWGFVACLIFLRYCNLYPLAIAHAIFGVTIALTVPGHLDHNMRVGLGYLTYHPSRDAAKLPPLPQP